MVASSSGASRDYHNRDGNVISVCYLWEPQLLWRNVIADLLIAAAYFSIPLGLLYVVRRRGSFPFSWLALMFGTFIVLRGTTHIMSIVVLWNPLYWIDVSLKIATAVASIATVIVLVPQLPNMLALPDPMRDALTGVGNRSALLWRFSTSTSLRSRSSTTRSGIAPAIRTFAR